MITTDACLRNLYNEGKITYENALSRAQNQEELKRMLAGESDPTGSAPARPHRPGRRHGASAGTLILASK